MQEGMLFLKGFFSGFFYTFMPIYGIVLVSHLVSKKKASNGMVTSMGIICAQLIWAAVAWAIFLTLTNGLKPSRHTLTLTGAIILFLFAAYIYRHQERLEIKQELSTHFWPLFGVGFFFSLSSLKRILGYFALFAVLKVQTTFTLKISFFLLSGLLFGSLVFWLLFTLFISWRKAELSPKTLQQLHKISALILVAFTVAGLFEIYI